jgi:hypothetical protein
MQTWMGISILIVLAANIIVLVFSSFFKGYGQKKGENLATKEDLKGVVEQVKAVTRTTEEIKSEISGESWAKQRHWDIKRDTAMDIMRVYGRLQEASANLFEAASYRDMAQHLTSQEVNAKAAQKHETAYKQFQAAMTTFWQLEEIARLIFSTKVYEKMDIVKRAFNKLAAALFEDNGKFDPLFEELRAKQEDLATTIRAELGI